MNKDKYKLEAGDLVSWGNGDYLVVFVSSERILLLCCWYEDTRFIGETYDNSFYSINDLFIKGKIKAIK